MFSIKQITAEQAIQYNAAGYPVYQRAFVSSTEPPQFVFLVPDDWWPQVNGNDKPCRKKKSDIVHSDDKVTLGVRANPHTKGCFAHEVHDTMQLILREHGAPMSMDDLSKQVAGFLSVTPEKTRKELSQKIHRHKTLKRAEAA